ncbi:unnamed protein product [Effrenium voratum]|nr:unnamed protein product [Effrenium voratum]
MPYTTAWLTGEDTATCCRTRPAPARAGDGEYRACCCRCSRWLPCSTSAGPGEYRGESICAVWAPCPERAGIQCCQPFSKDTCRPVSACRRIGPSNTRMDVPILHSRAGEAKEKRVWLLKVWTDSPSKSSSAQAEKRLASVLKSVPFGVQVLFRGKPLEDGLPMLALRADRKQLKAMLEKSRSQLEFVEQDSVLQETKDLLDVQEHEVHYDDKEKFSSRQAAPPSWGLDRIDQRGAARGPASL